MTQPRKIATVVPVTKEIMADAIDLRRMFGAPLTEQERRAIADRLAAEAVGRARVRAETPPVELTVESLLSVLDDVFGVHEKLARHMIQTYCGCQEESEGGGVYACQHWDDLQKEKA